MAKNKVLIIAPHMDDEVLGCGGCIAKHKQNKDTISVVFIAHRIYNHLFNKKMNEVEKKHALRAKSVLKYDNVAFLDLEDERLDGCVQEIIIPLEKHIQNIKPNIVYLSFRGDNNQDHRAVFEASRVVLRPLATPFIKEINMYEVPSSTDQSPPFSENAFLPNYFINITKYIDKKIAAYKCYRTEKRGYPHPRSEEALKIFAKKRGIESGFKYAETWPENCSCSQRFGLYCSSKHN